MSEKSVSLSVRLSPDESTFLATYNPPGATTLSEKLRAMIAEAQRNRTGHDDFTTCLDFFEDQISGPARAVREAEHATGLHSELLALFSRWMPEAIAVFCSGAPDEAPDDDNAEQLANLEQEIADRVFTLFEQMLRLNVTGESPCYNPHVISKRSSIVVKLCDMTKLSSNQK